jgi:DNA ligase D-like protein (predicted ligase)
LSNRDKGGRLEFVPPQIPTLVEQPPEEDSWVHEIKFDGYRTQIIIDHGGVRLYTKTGQDWTAKYWPIVLAAEALPCRSAILDGEVIVANERGAPDFDALLAAIGKEPSRLAFVAFDILHLDGRNLRPLPLIERKQLLWQLVEPGVGRMQFSEHFEGDALAIFRAVERLGLEGIVSKQADSRYRSGPSKTWLKAKYFDEADFELLGVLREPGEAPMALMATHDAERRYVGSAIIALNREMRDRLWKRVETKTGPSPKGVKKPGAQWTRPGLVGRVRYLKGEGPLRHATLTDLREE